MRKGVIDHASKEAQVHQRGHLGRARRGDHMPSPTGQVVMGDLASEGEVEAEFLWEASLQWASG
jgi:hypothetical protein